MHALSVYILVHCRCSPGIARIAHPSEPSRIFSLPASLNFTDNLSGRIREGTLCVEAGKQVDVFFFFFFYKVPKVFPRHRQQRRVGGGRPRGSRLRRLASQHGEGAVEEYEASAARSTPEEDVTRGSRKRGGWKKRKKVETSASLRDLNVCC